jgi:hypothetical protein
VLMGVVVWEGLGMGRGRGWRRQRASGAKWCLRGWPLVSWLPWLHSVSREALAPLFFNRATRITEHQDGAGAGRRAGDLGARAGYSMGRGRQGQRRQDAARGRVQQLDAGHWALDAGRWTLEVEGWGSRHGEAGVLGARCTGDGVERGWDEGVGTEAQWMQAGQQMVGRVCHTARYSAS